MLPPLAEQRRIAEVLDRAEVLRAKRRAVLAQLDSLTQSIFLDLFGDPATNPKGWRSDKLAAFCDLMNGFAFRSSDYVELSGQLLAQPYVKKYYQRFAGGGVQINLGKGDLLSVNVVIPPSALQHEFARRVGAVEKLKTAQRASLAELDALFASLQHRAFRGEL